jgi:hypothetical protein
VTAEKIEARGGPPCRAVDRRGVGAVPPDDRRNSPLLRLVTLDRADRFQFTIFQDGDGAVAAGDQAPAAGRGKFLIEVPDHLKQRLASCRAQSLSTLTDVTRKSASEL